jgi:predicted MFS family arabinose efflux permease
VVSALDGPARQAFVVEMVGKEDLPSAIALNSGIFNGARVIGPSIAGFLIAVIGTGNTFIVNAVSYIAVIGALYLMRIKEKIHPTNLHPLKAIKEGISYAFAHPTIRTLLLFAGVVSIFGWSYTTILPFIVQNVFGAGASGLGYLLAATGLGAIAAVVLLSAFSNKVDPMIFIIGGNLVFCISILFFTYMTSLAVAMVCLFIAGFGLVSQFSTINATIQRLVEDRFRGRVMSIYSIVFFGFAPFGSLQIGYLTEHFGPGFAIRVGIIILLLCGIPVYFFHKRIQKEGGSKGIGIRD